MLGFDASASSELFPGRQPQIDALAPLLTDPEIPPPPVIFITGLPATGKTSVLKHLLKPLSSRVAWLNCVERFTTRLLLESALGQLTGVEPRPVTNDWLGPWEGIARCDNVCDFVSGLRSVLERNSDNGGVTVTFMVLDKAEKLRNASPTLLPALLELANESRGGLTLIIISHLTWTDFRCRVDSQDPFTVLFTPYTKPEMLRIIAQDCPPTEEPGFFLSFVELLYDVFHRPCRDLNELRHLVVLLFPKYIEPVLSGKATREQTSKLFGHIQPHVKEALHGLYLREISSSEWQARNRLKSAETHAQMRSGLQEVDLPYYTKFLLIAAFLASYNPPRLDCRFFAKGVDDVKRKKGGKSRGARVSKEGGKMRQQLLGPKSFPVERMLAIFYSILEDDIDSTADIQMQIASLITLRLLVRVTSPDRLDGVKCKCNVTFEFVRQIGKSVRFDVGKYLYDFM